MKNNNQIQLIHEEAMNLAEQAFVQRQNGLDDKAKLLYKEAFKKESEAALQLVNQFELEPSRSLMFKGAAILAFQAELYREAEKMVSFGLSGNPPEKIVQELREIQFQIKTCQFDLNTVEKYQNLPIELQQEVSDFIDFLIVKHQSTLPRKLAG